MPARTSTATGRCPRCAAVVPRSELLPVPRWQEAPGRPEPLPVPGHNAGRYPGGNSALVAPGTFAVLCQDCRLRTIQRRRYPEGGVLRERHLTSFGV